MVSHYYTKTPPPFQAFQTENPAEYTALLQQCVHYPQYILPDDSASHVHFYVVIQTAATLSDVLSRLLFSRNLSL